MVIGLQQTASDLNKVYLAPPSSLASPNPEYRNLLSGASLTKLS